MKTNFIKTILVALTFLQLSTELLGQRDYFRRPFADDSIWNLPIATGAQYAPAGLSTTNQSLFVPGWIGVHKTNPADPLRKVFDKGTWGTCAGGVNSTVWYQVNISDSFTVQKTADNGVHGWMAADGNIWEGMMFERCSPGSNAAQYGSAGSVPYSIYGNGIPGSGSHASGMSGVGGVIRSGELTSGSLDHALKVTLSTALLYYNSNDSTRGYRWPAKSADSYASSMFKGNNVNMELGSLLAIPASFNCDSLSTEPGKRICRALKTYGAYVVDSCCPTSDSKAWWFIFEANNDKALTVSDELYQSYNINLKDMWFTYSTPQTVAFKGDLDKLYNGMTVVTNTSAQYPKGPGGSTPPPPVTTTPPVTTIASASAYSFAGTVSIDGDLSEWAGVSAQSLQSPANVVFGSSSGNSDASGSFKALWDQNNLYLAIDVTDDSVVLDSPTQRWDDDSIEIYLDGKRDSYGSVQPDDFRPRILPNGTWLDELTTGKSVTLAARTRSGGYLIEARIPWSSLGSITPTPGRILGFDLQMNEDDDGGTREAVLMFSKVDHGGKFENLVDLELDGTSVQLPSSQPGPLLPAPTNVSVR